MPNISAIHDSISNVHVIVVPVENRCNDFVVNVLAYGRNRHAFVMRDSNRNMPYRYWLITFIINHYLGFSIWPQVR